MEIPDRLYFKIGDVAELCGLEPYVLRFWETQFPQLKPNKSGTGQRLYRRRDVEMALEIKRLVHNEGYTLSGARQALAPRGARARCRRRPGTRSSPVRGAVDGCGVPSGCPGWLHLAAWRIPLGDGDEEFVVVQLAGGDDAGSVRGAHEISR